MESDSFAVKHDRPMYTLTALKENRRTLSEFDAGIGTVDMVQSDVQAVRRGSPWDFEENDLEMFPSLRKRNFWVIQRHSATGTKQVRVTNSISSPL
jgi:hypothetical protein